MGPPVEVRVNVEVRSFDGIWLMASGRRGEPARQSSEYFTNILN
jgi:hypothetical protein